MKLKHTTILLAIGSFLSISFCSPDKEYNYKISDSERATINKNYESNRIEYDSEYERVFVEASILWGSYKIEMTPVIEFSESDDRIIFTDGSCDEYGIPYSIKNDCLRLLSGVNPKAFARSINFDQADKPVIIIIRKDFYFKFKPFLIGSIAHEFGHAIGFKHVHTDDSIMSNKKLNSKPTDSELTAAEFVYNHQQIPDEFRHLFNDNGAFRSRLNLKYSIDFENTVRR